MCVFVSALPLAAAADLDFFFIFVIKAHLFFLFFFVSAASGDVGDGFLSFIFFLLPSLLLWKVFFRAVFVLRRLSIGFSCSQVSLSLCVAWGEGKRNSICSRTESIYRGVLILTEAILFEIGTGVLLSISVAH